LKLLKIFASIGFAISSNSEIIFVRGIATLIPLNASLLIEPKTVHSVSNLSNASLLALSLYNEYDLYGLFTAANQRHIQHS
jgi:hypothetical protein